MIFAFFANAHVMEWQALMFIMLAIAAALIGELFVRKGLPNIVGIMVLAMLCGNVFGISDWGENPIIMTLAEIGAIVILFYAGLESDLSKLAKRFYSGLSVAVVGVVAPFALIYPYLYFWQGLEPVVALLVCNVLVATSVAVTVGLFAQHHAQGTKVADIILVAAVIDDILGMLILGVVEPFATNRGETYSLKSTLLQIVMAVSFIIGGIYIGRKGAPFLGHQFDAWFHSGNKGKLLSAFLFCAGFVVLAKLFGLASIIGAFTAGLILDHTHFEKFSKATEENVEELVKPIRNITLPFFFLLAGISVDLKYMLDPSSLGFIVVLLILAITGKMISGIAVKEDGARFGLSNLLIGLSMIPRGEVGMVIALMGKNFGVFPDWLYASLVVVIFLTTIMPPVPLNKKIPQYKRRLTLKAV